GLTRARNDNAAKRGLAPRPGGAALRADRSPRALRPRLLRRRDPHLGARALPLRDSVCRAHLRYAVRPRRHLRGVSLLRASYRPAGRPLGAAPARAVAGRPAGRVAEPGAAGRKRASGKDGDVLAAFLPLAAFIWLLGLTGFLLWPFRYGLPWYIAGLARPVGLGVILVGLMREQIWLYREIISKNRDLTAR